MMVELLWIPLSQCELPHWRRNREALERNQPGLAQRLESQHSRSDIQIKQEEPETFRLRYETPSGAVSVDANEEMQDVINAVCRPIAQAFHQGKWLCLVMGCGAGWHVAPLVEYLEQKHPGEPKGILVLEHDPGLLLAFLGCVDLSAHLESGRVMFAAGTDLAQDCQAIWDAHHLETLDEQQIGAFQGMMAQGDDQNSIYQETLQTMLAHHKQQRQAYFDILKQCENRWSNPKAVPERVWAHITDDRGAGAVLLGLIEGFHQIGLQADGLRLTDRLFTRFYRSAYDFYQHAPDLMLCVNHSSNYVSWFAQQAPIPRLVWYVDHPKNTVEFDYHPEDRLLLIAENFRDEAQRRGGKALGVLPVGAPHELEPPKAPKRWRHDVSYVGSVIDNTHVFSSLPTESVEWINAVVEDQADDPLKDLKEVMAAHPCDPAIQQGISSAVKMREAKSRYMNDKHLLDYFLYGEANTRRRLRYVESLSDIESLGIYGPPAWKTLLPESMKERYLGRIDSADELHSLYHESKINLSFNALQGFGFLNPRVFEVPAVGAFLLTEWTPGLDAVYQRDEEMVWFENPDVMLNSIQALVQDEKKRFDIVTRAQSRIAAEHTYASRAKVIINLLKEDQGCSS
ncbi:MAG: glycosyltransferase [Candidatus Hinthialibacter antarcticus]|nr:glycosyltransferase [Candidatus Hinthialibacter antarcticus]